MWFFSCLGVFCIIVVLKFSLVMMRKIFLLVFVCLLDGLKVISLMLMGWLCLLSVRVMVLLRLLNLVGLMMMVVCCGLMF